MAGQALSSSFRQAQRLTQFVGFYRVAAFVCERLRDPAAARRSDIRKCTAADLTDVVDGVARSFYEDPIFTSIVRDNGQRLRELERGFVLFAVEPESALVSRRTRGRDQRASPGTGLGRLR
jgi:hypothetical protein